ncbi:MAG: hypothetical protein QNL62_14210 [Gammaproteobacteria bacterium]|nr:hypothetical protein [Gammaproteobacteria bacterium]
MLLPNTEKAIIPPDKIRNYLLSISHPIGRFKAVYFQKLGYSPDNWKLLSRDLLALLENHIQKVEKSEYGQKYEVRGTIIGPAKKSAYNTTVWIVLKNEDYSRFITAYPGDKK